MRLKVEVPSITDLATTTAYNVIEDKIPNVSDLVKKTDYEGKNIRNGKNISLLLTMINSWIVYFTQR